ncbi:MAG: RNA 2',3'-cyclic phosphodiesterase [Caulobacteraceae bacterium]
MIRLFAAIALPDDVAEGLARRQQGLPGARWRPREALHITLRFFGEVAEATADDLASELAVAAAAPAPTLELAGAGAFDERGEPSAVWAGVAENEALRRLAARCESAARRAGLAPEKRAYRPHVTLAYLRGAHAARVAAWIQGHNLLKSPPFRATTFGLYSSRLGGEGASYALERDYSLS